MEEMKVHVIDPMYEVYEAKSIEELHKKSIQQIQNSLCNIVELLFEGWYVKWTEFRPNFVKPIVSTPRRYTFPVYIALEKSESINGILVQFKLIVFLHTVGLMVCSRYLPYNSSMEASLLKV
jgi:hypothetical protein